MKSKKILLAVCSVFLTLPLFSQSFCECEDFVIGTNASFPEVLTACTFDDGNMGETQSFQIVVTSLPVEGVSFRVAKTVANGNWYVAPEEPLVLGENTKTVSAVSFARSVKFQFSDCNVEYTIFSLNAEEVCASSALISGCIDENACNFNPDATQDDQSCFSIGDDCDDGDTASINDTIGEDCMCQGEEDTSITGYVEVKIEVFPNPCSDWLQVSSNSVVQEVLLRDVSGRVIFSKNVKMHDLQIDMTPFPNNIYFLEILMNGRWHKKSIAVSH